MVSACHHLILKLALALYAHELALCIQLYLAASVTPCGLCEPEAVAILAQ